MQSRRFAELGVAICLCLAACGGVHAGPNTQRRSVIQIAGAHAIVPGRKTLTDYDADDYEPDVSDGDDDEIKQPIDVDGDLDGNREAASRYGDHDDTFVMPFGRRASSADARSVTTLVSRYFAAASAADGAAGCAMLLPSLYKTIPLSYGRPPGPPYMRGKTCAAVMTKIYRFHHVQIAFEASRLKVAVVRVEGNHALAILSFGGLGVREISAGRSAGNWKIARLLDSELP